MITLNTSHSYTLPAINSQGIGVEITDAELKDLIALVSERLGEAYRDGFARRIDEHVGANATYAQKNPIRQGLKVIYERFIRSETTDSEKSLIALKLDERVEHCTPGFHNGVNAIVEGLYLAKNMNDLLYRVRRDIVDRMASQLTDEVHANNRCFTVAFKSGYGVYPLNEGDIYRGDISDSEIATKLATAFSNKMNLPEILQGLEDQLLGQLSNTGYEGMNKEGQAVDVCEGMDACFMALFNDHPIVCELCEARQNIAVHEQVVATAIEEAFNNMKAFAERHPDAFTELNKFTQAKLNVLLMDRPPMFKPWAETGIRALSSASDEEFNAIKEKFLQQTADPSELRNRLNEATKAYNSLFYLKNEQVITDINWPNIRQTIWASIKKEHYFDFSNGEDSVLDILLNPDTSPSELDLNLTKFLAESSNAQEVAKVLNYFRSVSFDAKVAILQQFFARIPEGPVDRYRAFTQILHWLNDSDLKKEVIKQYDSHYEMHLKSDFPALITLIADMNPDEIAAMLATEKEFNGAVFFRTLAMHHPSSLASVLSKLQTLPDEARAVPVEYIEDALRRVTVVKPASIKPLMQYLLSLPESVWMGVLTQTSIWHDAVSFVFSQGREVGLQLLLEGLITLPDESIIRILNHVNPEGETILMFAMKQGYHRPLLQGLKLFPETVVMRVLNDPTPQGWTPLMMAVHSYPRYIKSILDVLKSCSSEATIPVLVQAIFTSVQYPDNIKLLLKYLQEFPEEMIIQAYNQVDANGETAIIYAIHHRPDSLKLLLDGMQLYNEETMIRILTQSNSLGDTAFKLIIHNQPTLIPELFGCIAHPQKNSAEKLAMLLSVKNELANESKANSAILKATLNCIANLDIEDQVTFYNAWWISSPELKKFGMCELCVLKLCKMLASNSDTMETSDVLSRLFSEYQSTERKPDDVIRLYQGIHTILNQPAVKALLEPNQGSRHSMFFTNESPNASLVRQLTGGLQSLVPKVSLSQQSLESEQENLIARQRALKSELPKSNVDDKKDEDSTPGNNS